MSFIPKPHEIYKHFKGNLYQVTAIAEHTETGEQLVVYQALYGDFLTYARPLAMFISRVDREKYPDAVQEFRFELQGPEAERQRAELQEERAFVEQKEYPHESVNQSEPGVQQGHGKPVAVMQGVASSQSASDIGPASAEQVSAVQGVVSGQSASDIRTGTVEQKKVAQNMEEGHPMKEVHSMKEVPAEEDEISLDPLVLEFLDADSYGEQLNILAALHHRITDEMITTMAIACDIEINEGDIEERYEALKTCLLTLERYECNRLR